MPEPRIAPTLLSALSSPERVMAFASILAGGDQPPGPTHRKAAERLRAAGIDPTGTPDAIAATFAAALEEVRTEMSGRHHLVGQARAPEELAFRHGRLVEVPSNSDQLRALLDWLAHDYLRSATYEERTLKVTLTQVADDHALLRRHLVDFGYFTRDPHTAVYVRVAPASSPATSA
ncbi:DUF2087 domain-containing protein [Ruania halotolerans]|uniref:DUF2087 domain-containing protein n=1 Tax=Ruania halotolerans TaxID=2897773 RepID=UPI001E57F01A|nr:DUF2087 domain-containing protein [Ruania halotolerans]UFU08255.1 DUF2087 domain-containing protein [Ruania halotolerans]